jgi:predicted Fe-S protein YdhL (DUF1289 family)
MGCHITKRNEKEINRWSSGRKSARKKYLAAYHQKKETAATTLLK